LYFICYGPLSFFTLRRRASGRSPATAAAARLHYLSKGKRHTPLNRQFLMDSSRRGGPKRQKAAFPHVEKIENIECLFSLASQEIEGQTSENVKCHRPLRAPRFSSAAAAASAWRERRSS